MNLPLHTNSFSHLFFHISLLICEYYIARRPSIRSALLETIKTNIPQTVALVENLKLLKSRASDMNLSSWKGFPLSVFSGKFLRKKKKVQLNFYQARKFSSPFEQRRIYSQLRLSVPWRDLIGYRFSKIFLWITLIRLVNSLRKSLNPFDEIWESF